tara:strand:+ start:355 stop:780 length:426 start_codon:yes stop_codon:yes gene_type:complete
MLQLLQMSGAQRGARKRNNGQTNFAILTEAANRWRESATDEGLAHAFLQHHASLEPLGKNQHFQITELDHEASIQRLAPSYAKALDMVPKAKYDELLSRYEALISVASGQQPSKTSTRKRAVKKNPLARAAKPTDPFDPLD